MTLNINLNVRGLPAHNEDFENCVIEALDYIIEQGEQMALTVAQFTVNFEKVNQALNRLGAQIRDLKDKLVAGGLTNVEENEIFAKLEALAVAAEATAVDPADPVPVPIPDPIPDPVPVPDPNPPVDPNPFPPEPATNPFA